LRPLLNKNPNKYNSNAGKLNGFRTYSPLLLLLFVVSKYALNNIKLVSSHDEDEDEDGNMLKNNNFMMEMSMNN